MYSKLMFHLAALVLAVLALPAAAAAAREAAGA